MSTPWRPTIPPIRAGDKVSPEVLQPILNVHKDRAQHLFEKFEDVLDKSVLIGFAQLVTGTGVAQFSVVYFDKNAGGLDLAQPGMESADTSLGFKASDSAYVFGIVKDQVPSGTPKKVDVWLSGLIDTEEVDILSALLDDAEGNVDVAAGPLFLSTVSPGKLTFSPGGLAIYVGYAKSSTEILLNPSFDSVNEFFFNLRYPLLDRPVGLPVLSDTTWEIVTNEGEDLLSRVGWVSVDDIDSADLPSEDYADGSLFFYNLPEDSVIDADSGLTAEEKRLAKGLRRSLPPNPVNFSLFTVNGIIQAVREESNTDGIYFINHKGIFWYSDQEGRQPWSSDIVTSVRFKASASANTLSVIDEDNNVLDCPYIVGDQIKFFAGDGGTLNGAFIEDTLYTVASVDLDTNTFQLAAPYADVTADITVADLANIRWSPAAWSAAKGSAALRPRMVLMFTKINPDYKSTLVTSITPFKDETNDSTLALKIVSTTQTDADAKSGDLLVKFKLPISTPEAETPLTNVAIKGIHYDEAAGSLAVYTGPVVTSLVGVSGAKVTSNSTGAHVISFAPSRMMNLISSLEPENARLEWTGLNSYLTFDYNRLPCGFVGKILLPESQLDFPLQLNFVVLGKTTTTDSASLVDLKLSYNVMTPETGLTTGVTDLLYTFDFGNDYTALTNLPLNVADFSIPAVDLVPNGILNFRLQRPKPATVDGTTYQAAFGVVAAYWSIG